MNGSAFLLVVIAILFSVSGELLLKAGMNDLGVLTFQNLGAMLRRMIQHPKIIGGFAGFGTGAIFWLAAISRVNLSWAYPMLSLGYVLVLLFSSLILKEHVGMARWMGAVVIVLGVYLISRS